MRFVTYHGPNGPRVAGVRGGQYVDLNQADATLPWSLKEILAGGETLLRRAQAALSVGQAFDSNTVRLAAPIHDAQKVICIGLNYADHARETGASPPAEPIVFNKFPTAIAAHGEAIVLPRDSDEVDYEAELVVVIGRRARRVAEKDAFDYIAGYCAGNDVSARDWQKNKPGKQWLLGKSFDTFAPFGPELVTPDEVGDPGRLRVQLRLNGQTMQNSTTEQLIFSVPELVAYVSRVGTLLPGDVIFTGTPPGVGCARTPPVYLKPGDVMEVDVEKVGVLRSMVVSE